MVFDRIKKTLREKKLRRKIKSNRELVRIFKYHDLRNVNEITKLIREEYENIIQNYINESDIQEFKENSGEGTYFWFVNFIADITLFRFKKIENISEEFKFQTSYDSIYRKFKFKEISNFFPKEFFIFKIINTKKYYSAYGKNEEYFVLLQILESYYGFDKEVLDYTLRIRYFTASMKNSKLILFLIYDKYLSLSYSNSSFVTNLKQISNFLNQYSIRLNIKQKNIDLNQIGQYLVKLKLENSSFENYSFTSQYTDQDNLIPLPDSKIQIYDEGEFRFITYYKNKPIMVTEILIVSNNEIFIRQIQGIKGANINPELELEVLQFRLIEIWAKNMEFNILRLYGSKCPYRRHFKENVDSETRKRAEEKYDELAKNLELKLDSDSSWFKHI